MGPSRTIGTDTSGGWRLTDYATRPITEWSAAALEATHSVAYHEAGKLLIGAYNINRVYACLLPLEREPACERFISEKQPGGSNKTFVAWSGDNALASTMGDESSFSSSADDGYTFNDISNVRSDNSVVVDYAHTPDGIQNVLTLAKELHPKRIITVFGCGGDRDKEKRPLMGKVVSEGSHFFIITADNPRNENPSYIANDIRQGVVHDNYKEIIDRYEAIEYAIHQAQPGDMILLLGKGHETTQTLKDQTIHFNDREVAETILKGN